MKTRLFIFSALATLALAACSKPEAELNPENGDVVTVIGASLPDIETKMTLDGNNTKWAYHDRIKVNGVMSEYLVTAADGVGKTSAMFTFNSEITGAYKAIYPGAYAVQTETEDAVNIPKSQSFRSNDFGPSANCMVGTGSDGSLVFKHSSSFIRLTLSGSTVAKIIFESNEEPVSGKFAVNYETAVLTPVSGSSYKKIIYDCAKATASEDSYIIAIPAQTYSKGFKVTIVSKDGKKLVKGMSASYVAAPGVVKTLHDSVVQTTAFNPTELFGISNADEWREFVADHKKGFVEAWTDANGVVNLLNDFTLTDFDSTTDVLSTSFGSSATNFTKIFDGHNHTITVDGLTLPLFGHVVEGTVKNLKLAGTMTVGSSAQAVTQGISPFVGRLVSGLVDKCENKMSITVGSAETPYNHSCYVAGIVTEQHGGTVSNCVNSGSIDIKLDCSTDNLKTYIGGIVGKTSSKEAVTSKNIEKCVNGATISLDYKIAEGATATTIKGLTLGCVGGIVGWISDGDSENYATLSECTNNGAITISNNVTTVAPRLSFSCGGVVGLAALIELSGNNPTGIIDETSAIYEKLYKCENHGNILTGLSANGESNFTKWKIYTGGIVGTLLGNSSKKSDLIECKNFGSVSPDQKNTYSRSGISNVVGGLIGLGAYVKLDKCEVGKIGEPAYIGTNQTFTFSAAGAIGIALKSFAMNECKINADITHFNHTSGNGNFATGVVAPTSSNCNIAAIDLSGSTITNCKFAGAVHRKASGKATGTLGSTTSGVKDIPVGSEVLYIVGESYTGTDITLSGNSLWE